MRCAWQGKTGTRSCFNGAAGVGPRMFRASLTRCALRTCFNGAAGVGPRMFAIDVATGLILAASMGPRGLARGCPELFAEAMQRAKGFNGAAGVGPRMSRFANCEAPMRQGLQWGRGGWPADEAKLAKVATLGVELQWGRGGWPADGRAVCNHRRRTRASMGPRGLARGSGVPFEKRDNAIRASMGPRGLARGWARVNLK